MLLRLAVVLFEQSYYTRLNIGLFYQYLRKNILTHENVLAPKVLKRFVPHPYRTVISCEVVL